MAGRGGRARRGRARGHTGSARCSPPSPRPGPGCGSGSRSPAPRPSPARGRRTAGVRGGLPAPGSLGLTFQPCFRQRMALLLPRRHPLARACRFAHAISPPHASSSPSMAAPTVRPPRRRSFPRGPGGVRARIGSTGALGAAVRDGLGVALVPVEGTLRAEAGLCFCELTDVDVTLVMGLARRAEPLATTAETALFAALSSALSAP